MIIREHHTGFFVRVTSDQHVGTGEDAVLIPFAALDTWPEDQLEVFGFYRVDEPAPIYGKNLIGFNYLRSGSTVTVLPIYEDIDLESLRTQKLSDLAAFRYQRERAGFSINGIYLQTDDVSQTKYVGAAVAAILDPSYSLKWKTLSGDFIDLNHDQVIGIASAVRAYIQSCFDYESTLRDQINAATTSQELFQVDITQGWPV